MNVCVPSEYEFHILKPFYLFKLTNKKGRKFVGSNQSRVNDAPSKIRAGLGHIERRSKAIG